MACNSLSICSKTRVNEGFFLHCFINNVYDQSQTKSLLSIYPFCKAQFCITAKIRYLTQVIGYNSVIHHPQIKPPCPSELTCQQIHKTIYLRSHLCSYTAAIYSSSNSANRAVPTTITPSKVKAQTVPKGNAEEEESYLQ